ncbi:hypothetical protein HWV62_12088 [Athelia sp. TMB]|nr:hypothetical protein HWV62_12088 [Athelia sp. TMB]
MSGVLRFLSMTLRAGRVPVSGKRDPLALLKLASELAPETFPTLKSTAGSTLTIIRKVANFKSNREDWASFGRFLRNVMTAFFQSIEALDLVMQNVMKVLENIVRALELLNAEIDDLQQVVPMGRIRSFSKDRQAIKSMKKAVEAALTPFCTCPVLPKTIDGDAGQLLTGIVDRYREYLTAQASESESSSRTNGVKAINVSSPYPENVVDQPPLSAVILNTNGTSGTVTNVVGAYNVYGVDHEQLVAEIKKSSALDKLSYAEGASWNPTLTCLPGTRVTTLAVIHRWSRSFDLHNIFWLNGVAGSGKSAIAHTVAQALYENGLLTSSFFFDREVASRNRPHLLFTTIAHDIAKFYPAIGTDIGAVLDNDPALASAHLSRQFEAFILGPLRRHTIDRPMILVIDALDETIHDDSDTELLEILRDGFAQLPSHFRVLITSRPMSSIERFLSNNNHVTSYFIDIGSLENQLDIEAYIDVQLRDDVMRAQMGPPWPDEALIYALKALAEGLFIWIATIFGYLRSAYDPRAKLGDLLSKSNPQGCLDGNKKIDALYTTILEKCGDWEDAHFCQDYNIFMGAIMAAKRPLSLAALRSLHGDTHQLSAKRLLKRFGSVLLGLHDDHEPIRVLHFSFREFVTHRAPETSKFRICEQAHSQRLAELCLQTMLREFRVAPISGMGYLAKDCVDRPGIPKPDAEISEQLLYGCESWSDHISDITEPNETITKLVQEFFPNHYTTSIEIISSTSVFHGSAAIRDWLKNHGLSHLFDIESQAWILSSLSNRLNHAGRLAEALTAIHESADLYRALASGKPSAYDEDLATSSNNLSNHLSRSGRHKEAMSAIQEALELCRALAVKRPTKFNNDLALYLNNYSNHLSGAGRWEEALSAIQEAVGIYRYLAADQPSNYDCYLAHSVSNLSNRLSDLGRHDEAVAAIHEAVDICRDLSSKDPSAYHSDLAASLDNLSVRLARLGRRDQALRVAQEAVDIHRALALERPVYFNAKLAVSLRILSQRLSDLGQNEEALEAIQECVNHQRVLALERPAAFNAALARSLNTMSLSFIVLGRREEALRATREAELLFRALAADRPATFAADLALSLNSLSNLLSDFGRYEEGLLMIQEAIGLRRALAAERPAAFNAHLAQSLNTLFRSLSELGRRDEALAVIQEAVDLNRVLAAEQPVEFNAALAKSLNLLSTTLTVLGRRVEALPAVQEAVRLRRALAAEKPLVFLRDLAESLHNLSRRLSDLCRYDEALPMIEEVVSLRRTLAADNPGEYNSDLAESLHNLSRRLSHLGRCEEAIPPIHESVRLRRSLVMAQPTVYNADLARSLNSLSCRLSYLGRQEEALSAVQEAVGLRRALAAEHPATCTADLSRSYNNLFRRLTELGRDDEALPAIRETVNLRRILAEEQPAVYTAALVRSTKRLSICLSKNGFQAESVLVLQQLSAP